MEAFIAGRDIMISDSEVNLHQHQSYKPLEECTNGELLKEKSHRRNLIKMENRKKEKISIPFMIAAGILFFLTYLFAEFFEDHIHPLIAGLTAIGAIGSGWIAAQASKKTEFEVRQEQALKEISFILREREIN